MYRDVFRAQLRKRCYRAPREGWWRCKTSAEKSKAKEAKAKDAKSLAASSKAFNAFRLSNIGPSLKKTLHEEDEEDLVREKVTSRVRLIAKTMH